MLCINSTCGYDMLLTCSMPLLLFIVIQYQVLSAVDDQVVVIVYILLNVIYNNQQPSNDYNF